MLNESAREELWFERDSIRLHAVAAGPQDGPVVLLLHGFPEFWYSWRKQIGPLAAAGFRVIVPDQRGYNLSSKPPVVEAYQLENLVSDIVGVVDQLGRQRVYLVGHDWGAVVAWGVALFHPRRLHKLGILNVPHPLVMMRAARHNPRQMLRSWYGLFFQLPWLPEQVFSAANFKLGTSSLLLTSRDGTFTLDDLAHYREAWSPPGAITAMLNWYRALFRYPPTIPDPRVKVPTRILWGRRDAFLLPELAEESVRYCDSAELTYFPQASHWIQQEEPEKVNQALIAFFRT